MFFVAPDPDLTPPGVLIFGEEDLAVSSWQIQFGCVVPVLHAAETIGEQQRLTSAHAEPDYIVLLLVQRSIHNDKFSSAQLDVNRVRNLARDLLLITWRLSSARINLLKESSLPIPREVSAM